MFTFRFAKGKVRLTKYFMRKPHPWLFIRNWDTLFTFQCGPFEFFYYKNKV